MSTLAQTHAARWTRALAAYERRLARVPPLPVAGRLTRMVGLTLEAEGCQAAIGDRCEIVSAGDTHIEAEVVGFSGERLFLMPTGDLHGMKPDARVLPRGQAGTVRVGPALLGRVVDGACRPLDGHGPVETETSIRLTGRPINPLLRQPITQALDVGVRAINGLLTVGRGQRIGLFAGSGVGKSVLLGMMARYTAADVIVVGLIGERGREVKEFIERILGKAGLARSVVVATPADYPPLMRLHGAWLATAIAEYFRDRGRNVLLIMDSLTRFAQAQREIALAIGEAPATKGYPPSVFARLPQLVERAGNGVAGEGSITAFYTVLAEGDDQNDPIVDAARAILDGHVVLARRIAEGGRYPAIDIEASVSRVMHDIVSAQELALARRLRQTAAVYEHNRDLIAIGAYQRGSDPRIDGAIARWPQIETYLRQDMHERVNLAASVAQLAATMADGPADAPAPKPKSALDK
ncbi:MAG TPA: flagellar protein export ATPase FliI [Steroidobacteraceae bacterium]|jgi:flagellum-specific ATP synthase|nr:flagellar protein export ATPase FliI [Steroidobacteraceae bacterium]